MELTLLNRVEGRGRFLSDEALPGPRTTAAIFIIMAFILWLDHAFEIWGQVAASVIAWVLLGALYVRAPRKAKDLLMACLVMAMFGEFFCSLVWKLYDYQYFNIPPYVPPSHVLVFVLGSSITRRMPRATVWLVPALVGPYALWGFINGHDQFGITLYIMFVACLLAEPERRLYATMFMLCLLLEIYGTALGLWTWRPVVPIWNMTDTNPPISAGVFYCLLDFLMLRLALLYWRLRDTDMSAALVGLMGWGLRNPEAPAVRDNTPVLGAEDAA